MISLILKETFFAGTLATELLAQSDFASSTSIVCDLTRFDHPLSP